MVGAVETATIVAASRLLPWFVHLQSTAYSSSIQSSSMLPCCFHSYSGSVMTTTGAIRRWSTTKHPTPNTKHPRQTPSRTTSRLTRTTPTTTITEYSSSQGPGESGRGKRRPKRQASTTIAAAKVDEAGCQAPGDEEPSDRPRRPQPPHGVWMASLHGPCVCRP